MKRKILVVFIILITLLSNIVPIFTYATEGIVQETTESDLTNIQNENIQIKGTNSFGQLLASEISDKTDDINEGNCIFSVTMNEKEATVEYSLLEDATIIVGIFEEDGIKLLATRK